MEYWNKERGVSILQKNKKTAPKKSLLCKILVQEYLYENTCTKIPVQKNLYQNIIFGCMLFCSYARGAAKKEDFFSKEGNHRLCLMSYAKNSQKKEKKREKNRGFAHCSFKYIVEKFLKLPPYLFAWRDSSNAVFPCNNKIKFFLRRIKAFYGEKQNSCKKVL